LTMITRGEQSITLNQKAHELLEKAKKKGETLSDVVVRLSETKVAGLQRRGEKDIMTSDGKQYTVRIDQEKCAGAESCVAVAPTVFALDPTELGGFRRGAVPLGMREVEEKTVDGDTIVVAAKSCPYRAINVKDAATGEELAGYD
jgi:ferredoxin/predicted CopG family antitoxin